MTSVIINFFKKLLKIERDVYMIDKNNLIAHFSTKDYPESGSLLLRSRDNNGRLRLLVVDSYVKTDTIYNIQTPQGHFIMKYL